MHFEKQRCLLTSQKYLPWPPSSLPYPQGEPHSWPLVPWMSLPVWTCYRWRCVLCSDSFLASFLRPCVGEIQPLCGLRSWSQHIPLVNRHRCLVFSIVARYLACSSLGLLRLRTFLYISFWEHMSTFLLGLWPRVELLGHELCICSAFIDNGQMVF